MKSEPLAILASVMAGYIVAEIVTEKPTGTQLPLLAVAFAILAGIIIYVVYKDIKEHNE